MKQFLTSVLLLAAAQAAPAGSGYIPNPPMNNLSNFYTLTAYAPWNYELNGLKVENFNLFQAKVGGYCPFTGDQASLCPNGTDMAFSSTLHPVGHRHCLLNLVS
jgi:hypothetical protein